jgi:hypothetical protein
VARFEADTIVLLSLVPDDYEIWHQMFLTPLYGIVLDVLVRSTVTLARGNAQDQTDAFSELAHEVDHAHACRHAVGRRFLRSRQLESAFRVYLSPGIIIVLYGGHASLRYFHWSHTHSLGLYVADTDQSGSDREDELVEPHGWI